MATYTITVNEKTREGKSLVKYLKSLGVIDVPNDETLQAMKDIEDGNVTVYKTFEDYLEAYNETDCDYQQVQKRLGIGEAQKSSH